MVGLGEIAENQRFSLRYWKEFGVAEELIARAFEGSEISRKSILSSFFKLLMSLLMSFLVSWGS